MPAIESVSASRLDVAVVGAGAAGSSAAYHLALLGHSVAVIEPGPWPQAKPCGGGMAASVQSWFPCDLAPVVDRVIDQVRFTWCLDDPVLAPLPGGDPGADCFTGNGTGNVASTK